MTSHAVPDRSPTAISAAEAPAPRPTAVGAAAVVLRVALAGLFLFAAWNKLHPPKEAGALSGPQSFVSSIQGFKLGLPETLLRASTSITPWLEVVAGLFLLMGIWVRASAAVIAGLLVMFIILILSVFFRNYFQDANIVVDCGCFGKLSPFCPKKLTWCNVVQNSVMLAAAGFIAWAAAFYHPWKATRLSA